MAEIMVSVICNAFNHEKYIRDALEGFVMQKTSFAFEVLVHDDASTDKTADIISEYAQKYPELVLPVLQTENQYSQGRNVTQCFQVPRMRGKYVAFCEGDDYWTDPLKLQKQVDALESHPELDICAHTATATRNEQPFSRIQPSREDCIFTVEQVIRGGGGFVATNSLVYSASLLLHESEFRKVLRLDYTMQVQGALRGGMLYLKDNMSVYREQTENSWTRRTEQNADLKIRHCQRLRNMLQVMDEETKGQYHDAIMDRMLHLEFDELKAQRKYGEILKNRRLMKVMTPMERIKTRIRSVQMLLKGVRGSTKD